jgi:hypothetical protein
MSCPSLAPDYASAALGRLSAPLIRAGRRLRRPLRATSTAEADTLDSLGGLLIFTGLLMQIAADLSPSAARGGQAHG